MDMDPEEIGFAGVQHEQPQEGLFAVGAVDTSGGYTPASPDGTDQWETDPPASPGYTPASPDGTDPWETDQPEGSFEDPMKDYETKKKSYQTTPVLTKYEKTRVLGQRANQIINGSEPLIPTTDNRNPYDIALLELNQKKIPFIVKRPYGNTFEYWKLEDLL